MRRRAWRPEPRSFIIGKMRFEGRRAENVDVFDGHCDTVLMCRQFGGGFARNPYHLDLERAGKYRRYAQFFALFGQPEDFPGKNLRDLTFRQIFQTEYDLFRREVAVNAGVITHCRTAAEAEAAFAAGKMAAFLSVEGAELLDCSTERLEEAHTLGVRSVNLTWNHANALSGTNAEETSRGLTAQGRAFVRKAETLGVLVDVSHLSDPGFWNVAETLSAPFWASHSNARAVFSHPRNLTDEQFTAIIDHGGVAGLNLYAAFLGEEPDVDTVIAHLEHWLELGGAHNVSLGGDLDGCSCLPAGFTGVESWALLYERLLQRNYTEALIQDLYFNNLMRVVSKVCIM